MNSLLDIGGAIQNALAIRNFQETQRRNDIAEQNMGLEQERLALGNRNAAVQERNAFQNELENTYKLSQDDRLQFMPEVRNKLLHKVAVMAGGPDIGISSVTHSMAVRDEYLRGLVSGNPDLARKGLEGLATSMPIEKLDNLMKATVGMEETQERIGKIRDWRAMNAGKVEALQNDNARVAVAKPLYTAVSASFRDDLRGTDSPQFKQLQTFMQTDPEKDWLSKSAGQKLGGQAFPHLLGGAAVVKAEKAKAAADQFAQEANDAQKMLIDAEHGIPLPPNITKAELRAKIETSSTLLGAYRDMQAWYENPLDKEKLKAAKAAYHTVESRRLDIENLEKKTAALTAQYRQDAMTFRQTEAEQKHARETALADAQTQYYELPPAQQTPKAAAQIAKSIKDSTGISVRPDEIFKNPNKPLVENKIIQTQEREEAKKVGGGFGEQYIALQKADVDSRAKMAKYDRMDQLLSGMQTGKLTPAFTQIQSIADSFGITVDKSLPAKQAFQALSGEIALTLRNPSGGAGMPGALSDKDLKFLQSMTPDLGKTTEGNKLIIETARALAKRDQDVARMAREYRKQHGQFDEGFFDKLDEYSKANPLFKGKIAPQGKAAPSGKAAQPQAQQFIETRTTKDGRKLGKTADGKIVEIK